MLPKRARRAPRMSVQSLKHGARRTSASPIMDVVDKVLREIGRRLAFAQNVEHGGLRGCHVGLVEGAHAHEVAAHGDGVLPHDEVLGQLLHGVDLVVLARDGRVDVGQAHLEVAPLVPQVGLGQVRDDAAVAGVLGEQQGVHLDVGPGCPGPSLPRLSATSCSIHRPSTRPRFWVRNENLLRPCT